MGRVGDLRLSCLGGFLVEQAGVPVTAFESDKARLLLAYLAVEADHPHRRESLAGLFWPDKPEALARHSLSQTVSAFKKILPTPGGLSFELNVQQVHLHLGETWLDIQEFKALIGACEGHELGFDDGNTTWACRACLERLERAAALYRGDFLAGYSLAGCTAFEEWLRVQQEAFRQMATKACRWLAEGFEMLGAGEKALRYAEQRLAIDPLDEAACCQVMHLLAQQGWRTEALAQYTAWQTTLAEELGTEPDDVTQALYERILAEPGENFFPPIPPHNLPAELTPLIGRENELEQVCHLLTSPACRLLTVLGGGGTGKSHLALEAAHLLLGAFPDGVFWVGLDTQPGGQALAGLIAQAIGLELRPGRMPLGSPGGMNREAMQALLSNYLSSKRMLLVLDGFEGSLHETGLVSHLLLRAAGIKILVTSRARLNLESEQIISLEGLRFPPEKNGSNLAGFSAVQLFVAAAQRTQVEFTLTEHNQSAVAEICRLTQGLPLGILLAAAWVGTLGPIQIVQEISRSLDFLQVDWQDLPDRQHSLRATFDHSWRLLSRAEQEIFLRLAVFHGPFTAERAGRVAGASLQPLRLLVNQSLLLVASMEPSGSTTRYRLHDLLHQYAQEKLAATSADYLEAHEQHCQVYLAALAAWEPRLKSREQPTALREMDVEYGDIRAAWEWALTNHQVEGMQKAIEALSYYHTLHGFFREDAALCMKVMESLEKETFTPASLRLWVHAGAWLVSDLVPLREFEPGKKIIEKIEGELQSRDKWINDMRRAKALLRLAQGDVCVYSGHNLEAMKAYQQGLELMQIEEDSWDISYALCKVATGQGQLGNVREMGRFADRALSIQDSLGDPNLLAQILQQYGFFYMLSGQYEAGIQAAQEQNAHLQQYDDPSSQAAGNRDMGLALYFAGQYAQARSLLEKAVTLFALPEQEWVRKSIQYFLACIDLHTGNYLAVLNHTAYSGIALTSNDNDRLDLLEAQVHLLDVSAGGPMTEATSASLALAEQELENYLKRMRSLPRLDVVGQALALLGYIVYRRGRMEEVIQYLEGALGNGLELGCFYTLTVGLSLLALMFAEGGDLEQAVELYATVTTHPVAENSMWFMDIFGKRITALTASLPAEVICAARARGASREYFEVGQQYLDKLRSFSTG
jgi:predicted ATPase/DNA-binding SARP family transcriptional activator